MSSRSPSQVSMCSSTRACGATEAIGSSTRVDGAPAVRLVDNIITLWGVPPEESHNAARLSYGYSREAAECGESGCPSAALPEPLLTLPTSCDRAATFTIHGLGTWEDEGARAEASVVSHNVLDTTRGSRAARTSLSIRRSRRCPKQRGRHAGGVGRQREVAAGSIEGSGRIGRSDDQERDRHAARRPGDQSGSGGRSRGVHRSASQSEGEGPQRVRSRRKSGRSRLRRRCSKGSSKRELDGDVYVLAQSGGQRGEPPNLQSHPPALQLLIAVSGDGVYLKLVANVQLNETTGQLTTTLTETPELPFTSFELSFTAARRPALATPTAAGRTPPRRTSPRGRARSARTCSHRAASRSPAARRRRVPGLAAAVQPVADRGLHDRPGGWLYRTSRCCCSAGMASSASKSCSSRRPRVSSGMLSAVPLCPEPQALKANARRASKIGQRDCGVRPRPVPAGDPAAREPESPIYLTGPYEGAPFGLSIVDARDRGPVQPRHRS